MKSLLFLSLAAFGINPNSSTFSKNELSPGFNNKAAKTLELRSQNQPGLGKMSAVEFKSQKYCRAELEDFEFNIHYVVIGATVYFSGKNFRNVEKATLTSNSLQPIAVQMERCTSGTLVVFDDVKVIGPDNIRRTIPGVALCLY